MQKTPIWLLPAAVAAVLAGACSQPTPEERVAEMRANYEATLQNFVVREEPMPGAEPLAEDAGAVENGEAEAAAEEDAAGAEGEDGFEELVPVQQNIVLDILIRNENKENLPGLTLDVEQVDSGKQAKQHWHVWVDTSTIGRGPGTSITHTLEDVDYEAGDGFNVSVRAPVPPGERGDYREFAEAS